MSDVADKQPISKDIIREYNSKKIEVDKNRIDLQYKQLLEQKSDLEFFQNLNLENNYDQYTEALAKENEEYLLRARSSKVFLKDAFRGKVPFFSRNIILLAAETGGGKSTLSANLTFNALAQGQRVLVISNEENPGDVYNRITALSEGIYYANHEKFTDEQINLFKSRIPLLGKRLTVVGDDYGGKTGMTTSIEGIESLLNSVTKNNNKYDLIIIDYYQNIDHSVSMPSLDAYQVQYRFSKFLDQYKNRSNAVIVLLAQKKPADKDNKTAFKDLIEGRKAILNVATCAIGVTKDARNYSTIFEIKKSRFNDCLGETITLGFEKGRYVNYTPEFKNKVQNMLLEKQQRELLNNVHVTSFNENGG